MKQLLVLGVFSLMAAGSVARAADTVTGEVVDLTCYMAHPDTGHGPSHRKCAEGCAKKGLPMAILTEDKQVVLLLQDHDNPKAYADVVARPADTVTVEGRRVTEGGATAILVQGVK